MFGAAMCLGDFVWLGELGPFFPPAPLHFTVLHFCTFPDPPFPSFFFGFLFNYSYVPLIPYRLNLSFQLKALSEFFSASRYLSGALASQRLSPTILTLYGI